MTDSLLIKNLLPLFLVTVLCLGINGFLIATGLFAKYELKHWWLNYVFLVPVTALGTLFIVRQYIKSKKITSIGKNYITYTAIKMVLSFVFLLPWLLNKDASSKPMIAQFFSIFFPFLALETVLLIRLLNTPLNEKKGNG